MKAFITGISGFVGKYMADYLVSQGHEVLGIDRHGSNTEHYKIEKCDILENKRIEEIVADFKSDTVFHLAAQSSVPKSFDDPETTKEINVEGTRNLFEAIIAADCNPVILVISSLQIYGQADKVPITEETPLKPNSPYAESKVEQENLCKEYIKKGLKIIISRSFNHTGPGQLTEFVVSSFAKQVADIEAGTQDEIKVGNIDVERDFSDVRDIVQAYLIAVEKGKLGETYNICQGKPLKLSRILDILKSLSTAEIKITVDESRFRDSDAPVLYGDHSKFTKDTGWEPGIPIEKTIQDLLDYWREAIKD